jgi:hypothetical protein
MGELSMEGTHGTSLAQGRGGGGLRGVGVSSIWDCCVHSIWVNDSICVDII